MKRSITTLITLAVIVGGTIAPQAASASITEQPAARAAETSIPVASMAAVKSPSAIPAVGRIVPASTGQYEYICIGTDGNSWSLRAGEPTTNCHGSYLHKYINGVKVASYRLALGGGIAAPRPAWNTGCVLAVASGVALFVFPPTGATAWVTLGGLAAAGLYTSCVA